MKQEYAFTKFAQSFNFFFSHGTTNSGGVYFAVHRLLGVIVYKSFEIPGHLLVLDLERAPNDTPTRIIGIYAPSLFKECCLFLTNLWACCSLYCAFGRFQLGGRWIR